MKAVALGILDNRDDVADALQDAAVALWKHSDRMGKVSNRTAYFLATVRNVCYSRLRASRRSSDLDEAMALSDSDRGEDAVESDNLLEVLLCRLPDSQRKAVMLSLCEKYDTEAIAEVMNISKDNVRQLLSRGRRALRELYQREMKK